MPRTRPLSPAVIARVALESADAGGSGALSMRQIAARLGCDPMALYRHFANREALLDAAADLALADVPTPDPATPWDAQWSTTARAIRSAALEHRGIASHLASRPPLGEHGRRLGGALITALTDAGVRSSTAVQVLQTLIAYIASALAMAVQAGTRDTRWHQASAAAAELSGNDAGHEIGDELFVVGSSEQFDFGLQLLIAGIRAEILNE